MIKIFIASDHAGFQLKEEIKSHLNPPQLSQTTQEERYKIVDFGPESEVRCDYPERAWPVACAVAEGWSDTVNTVEQNTAEQNTVEQNTVEQNTVEQNTAEQNTAEQNTVEQSFGILICGTGIGVSLAANRHPQIRAALVHNIFTAEMARRHNNAQIICLGARVIGRDLAFAMVDRFLKTPFDGERHQHRLDLLHMLRL